MLCLNLSFALPSVGFSLEFVLFSPDLTTKQIMILAGIECRANYQLTVAIIAWRPNVSQCTVDKNRRPHWGFAVSAFIITDLDFIPLSIICVLLHCKTNTSDPHWSFAVIATLTGASLLPLYISRISYLLTHICLLCVYGLPKDFVLCRKRGPQSHNCRHFPA